MNHPPTEILLVRHGESGWNRDGRVQGQSSDAPGLTEVGRDQAQAAARALEGFAADLLVVSDLLRARQTAEPIAVMLRRPMTIDIRLRERALGETEGTGSGEELHLVGISRDEVSDADAHPLGGESVRELYQRVAGLLDELRSGPHRKIVCVTHGGVVRVALAHAAGIAPEAMGWAEVDNASIWRLPLG
jgi:probable phosphoglycerate mutase